MGTTLMLGSHRPGRFSETAQSVVDHLAEICSQYLGKGVS